MKKSLVAGSVIACSVLGASVQAATPIWDNGVDTCTAANCGALLIPGTVSNVVGASTERWTIKVFAGANECLRLDQVAAFGAGVDDEMVVVAPNGVIYRNDDFGGTLRPRVVVDPTPVRGWYNVSIAHFTGNPAPEHDFFLRYGRYARGVATNCASPTPGLAPAAPDMKQPARPQEAPAGAPTLNE